MNWTIRISKVTEAVVVLKGRSGGKVLLIDTELHDHRGQELYALCIPNDVVSSKAQKWCGVYWI